MALGRRRPPRKPITARIRYKVPYEICLMSSNPAFNKILFTGMVYNQLMGTGTVSILGGRFYFGRGTVVLETILVFSSST